MTERIENRHTFMELHVQGLTNYEIELNSHSTKKYIINLLDSHKLCEYLKESYLNTVFNPNDLPLCNYFDEDEFIACNRNTTSHLNILSMNIRSLPKHSGELKCFIMYWEMNLISLFWRKLGHAIYLLLSTYLRAMFSFKLHLMWIFMVVLVHI